MFDTFVNVTKMHGLDFYYTYDELLDEYRFKFSDGNKHCECRLYRNIVQSWHWLTGKELCEHVINPILNNVKRELARL